MSPVTDPHFLLLGADDNVLVCKRSVEAGTAITIEDTQFSLNHELELGHKVARRAISAGELIVKYGAVIGVATEPIAAGSHVHVHNIASRYTRTHLIEDSP
jgi:hypothetical protein